MFACVVGIFINAVCRLNGMRRWWLSVAGVFLLVLAVRLYFAFQSPFLSSDESYFHLRIVESISNGQSPFVDSLGGPRLVSPIFHVIVAFAALFMPLDVAAKIFPNVFASLLVFPVFLISLYLSGNRRVSLATGFLASIVPAWLGNTFSHFVPMTLVIPVFFAVVYAWFDVMKRPLVFLGLFTFLVFLHPIALLLAISLAVYLVFCRIEGVKDILGEAELGLFSVFFALWAQFLMYKKLIVFHGVEVIWRNLPSGLLSSYFSGITILGAILQIGAYPLAEGVYALYKTAFRGQDKAMSLLLSVTSVAVFMLYLKLVELSAGLMILGVTLSILFAKWSILSFDFLSKTKVRNYASSIMWVSIVLALITTAIPAFILVNSRISDTISADEVSALRWLSKSSSKEAVVFAPIEYGHYVAFFAQRKPVMDDYFFLEKEVDEKFSDGARVFRTVFVTEAVELFDKYDASYLVVPPNVRDVRYADSKCFKRVWPGSVKIYEKDSACVVRVVG